MEGELVAVLWDFGQREETLLGRKYKARTQGCCERLPSTDRQTLRRLEGNRSGRTRYPGI